MGAINSGRGGDHRWQSNSKRRYPSPFSALMALWGSVSSVCFPIIPGSILNTELFTAKGYVK
jgi:hypothetical protein